MKKLKGILVLVVLLALLASPIAVLASDISGARYYGTIIVSNNSTATTNVAVNCTISTANLINGGYLNSSANNCVVRSSAGADLPFMPSVNSSYPWCVWVPSIGENSHLSDILYTANSTGGEIRYFPGDAGMTSSDNDTNFELGDNFTIEQSGWWDTDYAVGKYAVYKSQAFATYISATGNITSEILPTSCLSYVPNEYCNKAAGVVAPASGAELSVEGWFYNDALGANRNIVACGDLQDEGWSVNTDGAGKIKVYVFDSVGALAANFQSTNAITATAWHFFTYTYDNAAGTKSHFYLDGVDMPGADTGAGGNIDQPNTHMAIGARYHTAAYGTFFNGDIDEVRVSDNARTLAEHIVSYNSGNGTPLVNDEHTISLWHFNEGAGNPEDETGNNDLTNNGATWVYTSPVVGGAEKSVSASVSSGEYTITTSANVSHMWIAVDNVTQDTVALAGVSVPNTAANLISLQNNALPYMKYQDIEIDGVEQQRIEWEYDTTFTDLSGQDHDVTPTFRTDSSDADVSAELTGFLPISEAKAPSYALEEAPAFIETVPTIVSEWGVTPPAGTFPLASVIAAIACATDTPAQLPLLIIAGFVIIAFSLAVSATMRHYGSGSLIIKSLVITALMGVFIGIGNFGIDFWMLFVFLVIAIALAMGSKQVGWQ